MKVGILGSGVVARTLAEGFKKYGHDVRQGSRDAFSEIARFGEMIVLAVKGSAAEAAIKQCGIENLSGKTVIDVTNPIADEPPQNGVLKFFTGPNESLMERLQALAPKANFVKAFSCVGNAFMVDPGFGGQKPTMFMCGNNDAAKRQVEGVLAQFGWEWEDLGRVEAARAIEPLCMLWCIPGFLHNRWAHAFKLLKAN